MLSGTIIVLGQNKKKIVVAADSHVMSTDPVVAPPYDRCKLVLLSPTIAFASAGTVAYIPREGSNSIERWSSFSVAHYALQEATGTRASRVGDIADKWASEMLKRWSGLLISDPAVVIQAYRADAPLVTGIFAGFDAANRLVAYQVDVVLSQEMEIAVSKPTLLTCHWCVFGEKEVANEFLQQSTERARNEVAKWMQSKDIQRLDNEVVRAIRLVELTIAYQEGDHVGGPIDVLEISTGGAVRWIQRKKNCPEW